MEMEFKDTGRRRRLLLIGLGAALAIAAGYGAFRLASNGGGAPQVIKESVLVAAHEIAARTTLTADDVTTRDVPIDEILSQSYRDPADVVGRVTSVPIYADQQMTPSLFATATADSEFSILGPDETIAPDSQFWRAVAVSVPPERAVDGQIQDGQHVDLFVSVEIDILAVDPEGNYQTVDTATQDGLMSGKSTKITIQDLEVLKADPDNDMYILRVDLHQAEQIYHIVQVAPDSFSLALRPDIDTRSDDTTLYGTTTDRLIMTYLYPVPQLLDLTKLLGGQPLPSPTFGPGPSPTPPVVGPSPTPGASPSSTP
jgi:Flp pilus assembly protein CpaB